MTSTTSAAPRGRLALPRLLAFSLGSIPAYMMISMLSVYLPPFYAGRMGVTLTTIGATIGLLRLTDLGLDLALGWMMDKTRTPMGRYRPWYLAGLPVRHLRSLLAQIARLEPAGSWALDRAIARGADLLRRRGVVLIVSDFYDATDATCSSAVMAPSRYASGPKSPPASPGGHLQS